MFISNAEAEPAQLYLYSGQISHQDTTIQIITHWIYPLSVIESAEHTPGVWFFFFYTFAKNDTCIYLKNSIIFNV